MTSTRRAGKARARRGKPKAGEEYVDDEAVTLAIRAISLGAHKWEVKQALDKYWDKTGKPPASARCIEIVLAKARSQIRESLGRPVEETKGDSLEFYRSILMGKGSVRDKIRAQERIDKILGHEAPIKVEEVGDVGDPRDVLLSLLKKQRDSKQ